MRFNILSLVTPLAAAAAFFIAASSVQAHQLVYADPYGNLIILSPSGYKQIIVGKGDLADEVRKEIGDPVIIHRENGYDRPYHYGRVYGDPPYGNDAYHRADAATCIPYGVVFRGRALMYGVNSGEAVYASQYCR